jgi:hypothetical protein
MRNQVSLSPSDSGPVVNGWHKTDDSGRPTVVARPFIAPAGLTNPWTVAFTAPALDIPAGTGSFNVTYEPLAKFIDRVIFPPLEGASLSPSVKPEPA